MLMDEIETGGQAGAGPEWREFLRKSLTFKKRDEIDLDTHISLKHRYVYLMVSKAASSTVTYHLQCAEYRGTPYKPASVNERLQSPHIAPFQLSPQAFAGVMLHPRFRKLTFVRNPYSRMLSCYLHRIVGTPRLNPSKKVLARHARRIDPSRLSFEQFVDIATGMENAEMERHWAVQHDAVLYPLVRYDFVGRQESLIDDLLALETLLFGKPVFDRAALGSVNKSPRQTGSTAKLREHYTDRIAAKVAERYAIDFDTFGYSRDLADAS
jgi:hypothetical protein